MGFFSGFVHTFQKVGKAINKGFAKPLAKTFTAIPKIKLKNLSLNSLKYGVIPGLVQSALEVAHPKIGAIHGAALDTTAKVFGKTGTGLGIDLINSAKSKQIGYLEPVRRQPMAFNIGGFLGNVGDILSKSSIPGGSALGSGLSIASSFIPGPRGVPPGRPTVRTPAGSSSFVATPAMASVPALGGAVATVGRGFFTRFPNLAAAIQGFRNTGRANITRAKLYSGLKRFGPDMLISGGILTAAAVSELAVAGPGHRRMNVANVKALRKSLRRMEAFHKLCMRVDKLRPRRVSHAKNARR